MALDNNSSPSSLFAGFLNKAAFPSPTPCLSTFWPVLWRAVQPWAWTPQGQPHLLFPGPPSPWGGPLGRALTQYALIVYRHESTLSGVSRKLCDLQQFPSWGPPLLIYQIGVIIVIYPRRRLQREFRETLLQSTEQSSQVLDKDEQVCYHRYHHYSSCDLGKWLGLFNSGSLFPVERKEKGLYPFQEVRWKMHQGIYLPW